MLVLTVFLEACEVVKLKHCDFVRAWPLFFFVFSFDVDVLKNTFFGVAAPGSVPGWLCRIFVSDFSIVVVVFVFVFCLFCLICFCFCFFFF